MPMPFAAVRTLLERAVAEKAFPAAVIEVGQRTSPLWREAYGRLTYEPDSAAARDDTVFDLASLTKVIATASLVMRDVERGALGLDDHLGMHLPAWRDAGREAVTLRDLLAHCSGLPGHLPFFRQHEGRAPFEAAICATALEYPPRSRSIYSDLGFMLLGFVLERETPLAARFDTFKAWVSAAEDLQFHPPGAWRRRTAPTQQDPWRGRLLVGEVDDENAWALGGAAGHAGLFGTVAAVGAFARHLLQVLDGRVGAFRRETLEDFVARRTDVPGSSRALAWDTMLPTSSCGARLSPRAFGHTGFTGTSLWIDPDRAIYVVLLTNRVYPDRKNDAIARVRPAVHDAVVDALS
jgi:CubicO group peptidase (beta-lactamase class C family)